MQEQTKTIEVASGLGQSPEQWQAYWSGRSPAYELRTIDNLFLRPWILKYMPRQGVCLEAGCGLGKYVFYLGRLGIRIIGLEFEENLVAQLRSWAKSVGLHNEFHVGDVTRLPYQDNSLSGYLSLGVVEHFVEGPMRPLLEAYRVLRPGGIAIIETPAPGYGRRFAALKETCEHLRAGVGGLRRGRLRDAFVKMKKSVATLQNVVTSRTTTFYRNQFWQYEFGSGQLARNVKEAGFELVRAQRCDLRYNEYQLGHWSGEHSHVMNRLRFLDRLESSFLVTFGAFSIVVAVKPGRRMYCFLCGNQDVQGPTARIPICERCQSTDLAAYYQNHRHPGLSARWVYDDAYASFPMTFKCSICGCSFESDELFGDSGFLDPVCDRCIKEPGVNIRLVNERLKLTWRHPLLWPSWTGEVGQMVLNAENHTEEA